jgi:hypothetical protein
MVCHNSIDRGCGDITLGAVQAIDKETLHPVGAGLLGAGMAVAFMLIVSLFLFATGCIRWGKKNRTIRRKSSDVRSIYPLACGPVIDSNIQDASESEKV